jgi:ribosomal protein S6
MAENTMPAAEVKAEAYTDEVTSYEFAFHILPTVAEGEVPETLTQIKAHVTKAGGEIFDEEAPERIDLVYPIVRHLEGKNRKFTSSYFGWIRFRVAGEKLDALQEELRGDTNILRFLMVKLTKIDEINPFRFHEHRKSMKMVEVVNEEVVPVTGAPTEVEVSAPVEEEALNASLDKITHEGENSGTEEVKTA